MEKKIENKNNKKKGYQNFHHHEKQEHWEYKGQNVQSQKEERNKDYSSGK